MPSFWDLLTGYANNPTQREKHNIRIGEGEGSRIPKGGNWAIHDLLERLGNLGGGGTPPEPSAAGGGPAVKFGPMPEQPQQIGAMPGRPEALRGQFGGGTGGESLSTAAQRYAPTPGTETQGAFASAEEAKDWGKQAYPIQEDRATMQHLVSLPSGRMVPVRFDQSAWMWTLQDGTPLSTVFGR